MYIGERRWGCMRIARSVDGKSSRECGCQGAKEDRNCPELCQDQHVLAALYQSSWRTYLCGVEYKCLDVSIGMGGLKLIARFWSSNTDDDNITFLF